MLQLIRNNHEVIIWGPPVEELANLMIQLELIVCDIHISSISNEGLTIWLVGDTSWFCSLQRYPASNVVYRRGRARSPYSTEGKTLPNSLLGRISLCR